MSIKLIFLDLEGTLVSAQNIPGRTNSTGTSLWSRLFHELGPEALAADNELMSRWEKGEINGFVNWIEQSVASLQRFGLREALFRECIEKSVISPGASETLAEIHRRGIRTAIVSGGFYNQARVIQLVLGINHAYAAVELNWNKDGTIRHANIWPSDYAAKVDFVELMRRECNVSRDECAFVGDGKNDVAIAGHVGVSFAYRAHPELRAAATYEIEELNEMLPYLF